MWPFKPEVELTPEAYMRWLRAQRPQPLPWFLSLTEMEQAAAAELGDAYVTEVGEVVASGASAQDDVAQLQRAVAEHIQNRANGGAPRTPPSMAGMGRRRAAAEQERDAANGDAKSFMGRKPDEVEEVQP